MEFASFFFFFNLFTLKKFFTLKKRNFLVLHLCSLLLISSSTLPTPLPLRFPWHHHSSCASCLALPFFLCLGITMYVVLCHFRLLPLWSSFVLLRLFFPCASSIMHPACHHQSPCASPCADYQSFSPRFFPIPPFLIFWACIISELSPANYHPCTFILFSLSCPCYHLSLRISSVCSALYHLCKQEISFLVVSSMIRTNVLWHQSPAHYQLC